MRLCLLLACLTLAMAVPARADEMTVDLPRGETYLGDVGTYLISYQSYGGQAVEMPVSWTGHFTDDSGIAYLPNERVLGRRAILLHSPWRVPPGKVQVDYRLRLPAVTPIRLAFGIAMSPDVAGKSDGVTFSCLLVGAGRDEQLMREHYDKAEWRDFEFDLSRFAGQEVVLRLQTEPGPRNDPSWDFSYFGDARILAGAAGETRADLLKRLASAPACRAALRAGALPLANDPQRGIVPPSIPGAANAIVKDGDRYRFTCEGKDCRVAYVYTPKTGTLDDFSVQVDDGVPFRPAMGGGAFVAVGNGPSARRVRAAGGTAARADLNADGSALDVLWDYGVEHGSLRVTWHFSISGKALVIRAEAAGGAVVGFSLGDIGFAPLRRPLDVPYLPGRVDYLPAQNLFACRYLDWTVSHASQCPQGTATYEPKTDGMRNSLLETGYVAVSPNVDEVLPGVPHPPSPHLSWLAPLVMLDIWGWPPAKSFRADADNLRRLKDNGIDHLALIQHVWQRYGYDVKLPDHIPADPDLGGEEGMAEFGRAANECGYLWSLHENYIDLYPDAPSYDRTAVVLRPDGTPSPAWYNPGTRVQSFGLKCNRAIAFALMNSPEMHRRYGTTAAYLDVHTCVPPWHQLDHDAAQPMAAMALAKVKSDDDLFRFMRATHEGPLFGEGANHFYWAGLCDGVEAQVAGGEDVTPFLDLDLLRIHPQMVNHGMGYYERWFERGYGARWGVDAGSPEQLDKYRTEEVAFGHAGFIGAPLVENVRLAAREHHLMHPVQRLYGGARATEIAYEVDGQYVPASVALAVGDLSRQRIRYDSGLTVWANWRAEPWEVEGRVLPQWGFLALGPDAVVWTALLNGRFADYAECPEYVFADARTSFDMPYVHRTKSIEPKLRDLVHLGGNRVRLTYEWVVNDEAAEDYACFVHFTSAQSARPEQIEFQQDHALPRPTSQWRKGEVITDGPYEVEIPDGAFDSYDIMIGLHRGARVALEGAADSGDRVLIGALRVKRRNGRAVAVSLGDISARVRELASPRADFAARLNAPGTWADFGKVATDGAVKVNREARSLTVFPYPRDREFRVELDLAALAPGGGLGKLQVRALAARTQADMGPVEFTLRRSRLSLALGKQGAGRYVVSW